jgi:hypothetical protein
LQSGEFTAAGGDGFDTFDEIRFREVFEVERVATGLDRDARLEERFDRVAALPTGRQRLDPVGLCDDGDVVDLDGVVFREILCDRERGLLLCRFVGNEVEDRLHISIGRPARESV